MILKDLLRSLQVIKIVEHKIYQNPAILGTNLPSQAKKEFYYDKCKKN